MAIHRMPIWLKAYCSEVLLVGLCVENCCKLWFIWRELLDFLLGQIEQVTYEMQMWDSVVFKLDLKDTGVLLRARHPANWQGMKDNFAQLVYPPTGTFFLKRSSVLIILPNIIVKTSCPPAEKVSEPVKMRW